MKTRFTHYLALLAVGVFITTLAQAATNVWSGAGTDNTWTNTGNWFGPYTPGDTNLFTNVTATIDFNVSTNTDGFIFSAPPSTVFITNAASTMTITDGYGLNIQSGTLTIAVSNITLGANQAWVVASGAALTVSSRVTNAGFQLIITNDDNVTINGIISGAGGLTKSATGILLLTAPNTYTAPTTIEKGTLTIGTNNTLRTAGALILGDDSNTNNAGTLDLNGFSQTISNLTVTNVPASNAAVTNNIVNLLAGQTLIITNRGTANVLEVVEGAHLSVTGGGRLNLVASNGTVEVNGSRSATIQRGLDVSQLSFFSTIVSNLYVCDDIGLASVSRQGILLLAATNSIRALNAYVGYSTQDGTSSGRIVLGPSNVLNIVTLNVGFGKATGTVGFATGSTGGQLILAGTNGTRADVSLGRFTVAASNTKPTGILTVTNTGSSITASLDSLILGSLEATAGATAGMGALGLLTFTNGSVDVNSVVLGQSLTNTITRGTGAGTLTMNGGQLTVNTEFTIGKGTVATGTVAGTFILNGGTATIRTNLNDGGGVSTLILNGGTLDMRSNAIGNSTNLINTVTLLNGTLMNVGQFNGGADLIKATNGTVIIKGTNAYTGATAINVGTIALGTGAVLSASSNIRIAAGATFDVSGLGASATYTLGTNASLTASGTGTVVGTSAAAIVGGASGTVSLSDQPIILNYNGSQPALYISQGTLSLTGNPFTVNSAAPLATGTYTIIRQATGNVVSNGIFTVSGTAIGTGTVASIQISGSNVNLAVAITPPHLAVGPVNSGANPTSGIPFNVAVQSQVGVATPSNVLANTAVTLSLATGTGILGGTLTGTILAGSSSVTISGVTYTKAESGVVLTATRTSGDNLPAGTSSGFTVNAGAATRLALTSGNNQSGIAGAALAMPFVVTVTDTNGNPVSGVSVTFAIAAVPGGATGQSLSTLSATTAANGQAATTLTLGNVIGTYTVTATAGTLSGSPVTFNATATGTLAITAVNGGTNPTAGTGFSVVVQAQGAGGTPLNVMTNTSVTLSLATGTGTLGGTLSGTILAGGNAVTLSGVTYTKAESGVVLRATRTSGDPLPAGNSAPFVVNAGAAATIALTSGNNQSGFKGMVLANPFVVTVIDASGNPVSGTSVTFAIAAVPGGATGQSLSTTTTTTGNGQASTILTLGNTAGTYTVTATSGTLSGSPVTFTATVVSGNYVAVTAAVYEYQICFKCHAGYSWLPGSPPSGISSNGSVANPVQTDSAQEFSRMNRSGHPIVTGLTYYVNSPTPRALTTAQMRPPWNVNVGTQTMLCSDCHDATSTNVTGAAQGPHGSAAPFMLRGPNVTWPNTTSFAASFCNNCHVDTGVSDLDGSHGGHHGSAGCYTCHIVVPHGGKVSRLIATATSGLPVRYAWNNNTNNVGMTSFLKAASGGYSENGNCRTSCGHHGSGPINESW